MRNPAGGSYPNVESAGVLIALSLSVIVLQIVFTAKIVKLAFPRSIVNSRN